MIYQKQKIIAPKKNQKISIAVRSKFLFLLFLTIALIFDVVIRPPNYKLLENQSVRETAQIE